MLKDRLKALHWNRARDQQGVQDELIRQSHSVVADHLQALPADVTHIGTRRQGSLLELQFQLIGPAEIPLNFTVEYWLLEKAPYIRIGAYTLSIDLPDFWNNGTVLRGIYQKISWTALPHRVNWERI